MGSLFWTLRSASFTLARRHFPERPNAHRRPNREHRRHRAIERFHSLSPCFVFGHVPFRYGERGNAGDHDAKTDTDECDRLTTRLEGIGT